MAFGQEGNMKASDCACVEKAAAPRPTQTADHIIAERADARSIAARAQGQATILRPNPIPT
jgi:hypothetical protein